MKLALFLLLVACSSKTENAAKIVIGPPDEAVRPAEGVTPQIGELRPLPPRPPAPPEPPAPDAAPAPTDDPYKVGPTKFPGPPRADAQVKLGTVNVIGALPKEIVWRILRRYIPQYRYCYEQWLHEDPNAKGELVVFFVIAPTGVVSSADARKPLHDTFDNCVLERVKQLEFPRPEHDPVEITMPLELSVKTD